MPTIVSRLYETADAANAVAGELRLAGFPENSIEIVTATGHPDLAATIEKSVVRPATAEAYARHLTLGRALLIVRAPTVPFGAAFKAMEIVDAEPSIDAGVENPNDHINDRPKTEYFRSTLEGHPRWFSQDYGPGRGRSLFSDAMGLPLLSRKRERRSAIKGGKRFLTGVRKTPRKTRTSAISGGRPILRFLPLLSRRRDT